MGPGSYVSTPDSGKSRTRLSISLCCVKNLEPYSYTTNSGTYILYSLQITLLAFSQKVQS